MYHLFVHASAQIAAGNGNFVPGVCTPLEKTPAGRRVIISSATRARVRPVVHARPHQLPHRLQHARKPRAPHRRINAISRGLFRTGMTATCQSSVALGLSAAAVLLICPAASDFQSDRLSEWRP
mgnify:CR=1 FL=1